MFRRHALVDRIMGVDDGSFVPETRTVITSFTLAEPSQVDGRRSRSRLGSVSAASTAFPLLRTGEWLMSPGERAAVHGVLRLLRPSLSIEIGTASGGSLEAISLESDEVHSFDLQRHSSLTSERFPNVIFHTGDSHQLLPAFLEQLSASDRNVDFVLVDGDHSAQGVQRDVHDLLSSPSAGTSVILLHDTLNRSVRTGLEKVDYGAFGKVRLVDLDFVPGRVMREGPQKDEYWSGLGIIVTGAELDVPSWPSAYPVSRVYEGFSSSRVDAAESSEALGTRQLVELEEQLATQKDLLRLMEASWSWRLTAPLRSARRLMRRGH